MGICAFGYNLDTALEFWILALCVGICQGGIQALSRSQFGKMIPKKESSEYFGFFDIFGKFADFFGPLIISACAFFLHSSKYGVLSLIILFVPNFLANVALKILQGKATICVKSRAKIIWVESMPTSPP